MKLPGALAFLSLSFVNSKILPQVIVPEPKEPDTSDQKLDIIEPNGNLDPAGDILSVDQTWSRGDENHQRKKRVAISHSSRLWTDGIVPYILDPDLSDEEMAALIDGITDIEYHTCVDFYDMESEGFLYNPPFSEFLHFTQGSGCVSYVGRVYENQRIVTCDTPVNKIKQYSEIPEIAIHEMLHALGVYHEHNHRDRDDFVQIRFNNILEGSGYSKQFEVRDEWYVSAGSYSPSSIMHYSPYAFTKNNYRTIVTLDGYHATHHTETWEAYKQVNELYKCSAGCSMNCQHEGYPLNTGSGCTCVCVDWLSEESDCSDFEAGVVGEFVDVTTETTAISLATLSQGNVQAGTTYMWVLEAPAGYRLLVDFNELEVASSEDFCVSALSIKRRRLGSTDKVVCGSGYNGTIFSHKNLIALVLESESSDDVLEAVIRRKHESDWCYNVEDKGATYNGEMNRAADNSVCLNWALTSECEDSPLKYGDLAADYSGNACRNPYGKRAGPWCFTNMDDGGCDIKYCDACGYGQVYDTYHNCVERLADESNLCDTEDGLFGCRKTCDAIHIAVTSPGTCSSPGPVTGSSIIGGVADSYPIGGYVTYQCDSNTIVERMRFCLSTGEWSTLNAVCGGEIEDTGTNCVTLASNPDYCTSPAGRKDCARTCQDVTTCTLPEPSENTERVTGAIVGAGHTGEYRCLGGFIKLTGDEQRTCRSDGTLTGDLLACTVGALRTSTTCDVTDPASSDHVTCSQSGQIDTGLRLECQCDPGYTQVSGDASRECFDGGILAGQQPVCKETSCDTTTGVNVQNLGTDPSISPGAVVTYECTEGYQLVYGDLTRSCSETGILDGHAPICAELFCNVELTVAGSNAVRQSNSIVKVGEEAQYACLPVVQCTIDQPSSEDLVALLSSNHLPVGMSATYECTSGQLVEGALVRECLVNGSLSGSSPRCSDNECTVPDLSGANVQRLSASSVGMTEVAEYRCLPGFALESGNLLRTCGTNGILSGSNPKCAETMVCVDNRGDCGAMLNFLPTMCASLQEYAYDCPATCGNCLHDDTSCKVVAPGLEDAVSVVDGSTSLYPGQVVEYQCDPSMSLATGDLVRACRLDGTLTGKPPKCSDVAFVPRWLNSLGRMRLEQPNVGQRAIFGPSVYTTIPTNGLLTCWRFYCHATGQVRFVVIRRTGDSLNSYFVVSHDDYLCHEDVRSTYCPDTPIQVEAGDFIGFVDVDGGNLYFDYCSPKSENNYSELRLGWMSNNIYENVTLKSYPKYQFCWTYSLNAMITPVEPFP